MDTYMYRAALYCDGDADKIMQEQARLQPDRVSEDDSEYWPQGPFADGGGEADSPQHCDTCGVFLENPLTDDGREYVRNEVSDAHGDRSDDRAVLTEWIDFYGDSLA